MSGNAGPRKRLEEAMERARGQTPAIVQNVVLMEIADILEDQLEATRESTAHGLHKSYVVPVGPGTTQLDPTNTVTMPWKALVFANDGPAPVFEAINQDYFDPVPVNPNEQFPVDMGRDKIQKIMLTTTNPSGGGGGSASVRLFAIK